MLGELLEAIGLRFRDPRLESAYVARRANNEFLGVDQFWVKCHIPVFVVNFMAQYRRNGLTVETLLALLFSIAMYAHWWAIYRLRLKTGSDWAGLRTRLAIAYRFFMCPLVPVLSYPMWFLVAVTDIGSFVRFASVGCGTVIMICVAVFVPLPLKIHTPLQAAALFLLARFQTFGECEAAVHFPEGRQTFVGIWRMLNGASWGVLNVVYLTEVEERTSPDPLMACVAFSTWWLLAMGFVLPTYCLWVWEYSSRVRFFYSHAARRHLGKGAPWQPLCSRDVVWHLVLLALFLALSWQLLLRLYTDMDSRSFGPLYGGGPSCGSVEAG